MTVRKVSIKHPHFPEDYVFGVEGVGRLTNDGTPVEVDSEEFEATMGIPLEEALANDAYLSIEGATKRKNDIPGITAPSTENTEGSET